MKLKEFCNISCCFIVYCLHLTVNIALNKPAHQLHQYNPGLDTFDASNAVDGLKSDLRAWGGQCVVSADNYDVATWWVNLTTIQSIHHITIYYRTDNVAWSKLSIKAL